MQHEYYLNVFFIFVARNYSEKNVQARISRFPWDLGQCYTLLVMHVITGGDCAAGDNLLFVTLSAFSFLLLFFNESLSEVG